MSNMIGTDHKAYAVELLNKLIAAPTDCGNEINGAKILEAELKGCGFETEYQDIGGGRINLVARYGRSKKKLIFCGHLDVVPKGGEWTKCDPFSPVIENDRIYGRGATDMKGGIAAFTSAAIKAVREGKTNGNEIVLAFVSDEEKNSSGAIHFAKNMEFNDDTVVLIGEPTEFKTCIAHRGITQFIITVHGRQCHSSDPKKGINAIYEAMRMVEEIRLFDASFKNIKHEILPSPDITVTLFKSGVAPNVIPGTAEITVDCRTVPGVTYDTVLADLTAIAEKLYSGSEVSYSITSQKKYKAATCLSRENKAIELIDRAYGKLYGGAPEATIFNACCDLFCFEEVGCRSAAVIGPGSIKQAHITDEYIEIDDLYRAVDLYFEIIRQF